METPSPSLPWQEKTTSRWLELTESPIVFDAAYDFLGRQDAGGYRRVLRNCPYLLL